MSTAETATNSSMIAPAQINGLISHVYQSQSIPYRRKYNRTALSELKKKLQYYEDVKWGIKEEFTQENVDRAVTHLTILQRTVAEMLAEAISVQASFSTGRRFSIANSIPLIARKFPVSIENNYLEISVGDVSIRHNGEDVYIGDFAIRLNVAYETLDGIRITNKSNVVAGVYAHPHVREGRGCYGNIQNIIRDLFKQGEFDELVDLLVSFLRSYSGDNPYRKIAHWKGGYCSFCHELRLDCSCGRIGEERGQTTTTTTTTVEESDELDDYDEDEDDDYEDSWIEDEDEDEESSENDIF